MPRYRITIEYDGGGLVGWQRQDNGPSVQQALEEAVQAFCGETVQVQGAGRTDAGVHALGQVAHVDLAKDWPSEVVMNAVNHHLGEARIAILDCRKVDEDFHARFSATSRLYRYRIVNRRAPLAIDRGRAWHVPRLLDEAAMRRAAHHLIGRHDFSSFRAAQCQAASPVKTLDRLEIHRDGDEIMVEAEARSFLHNQVRAMVGSLKRVGEGAWQPDDMREARDARDRAAAGPNAPACGLYLDAVRYGDAALETEQAQPHELHDEADEEFQGDGAERDET